LSPAAGTEVWFSQEVQSPVDVIAPVVLMQPAEPMFPPTSFMLVTSSQNDEIGPLETTSSSLSAAAAEAVSPLQAASPDAGPFVAAPTALCVSLPEPAGDVPLPIPVPVSPSKAAAKVGRPLSLADWRTAGASVGAAPQAAPARAMDCAESALLQLSPAVTYPRPSQRTLRAVSERARLYRDLQTNHDRAVGLGLTCRKLEMLPTLDLERRHGRHGDRGRDGMPGRDGMYGTGQHGTDGTDGTRGQDGAPGLPAASARLEITGDPQSLRLRGELNRLLYNNSFNLQRENLLMIDASGGDGGRGGDGTANMPTSEPDARTC
jgi:hypothetical protein